MLSDSQITKHFKMLVNKGIDTFLKKPIKSKVGKAWLRREKKHQKVFKDPGQSKFFESIKIPVKVGDTILTGRFKNKKVTVKSIGTDDHGMPTINGKKVTTFRLLKGESYKNFTFGPDWIPTSLAQRKKMKKLHNKPNRSMREAPRVPRKKGQHRGSKSHSDLYTDENPKGTIKGLKFATVKDAKASVSKIKSSGKSHAHKIQAAVAMEQRAKEMGKASQAAVYRTYINTMKKKTKQKNEIDIPSPSRKGVERMKKKGNTSVPYGSGYKKVNEDNSVTYIRSATVKIYKFKEGKTK